MQDWNLHSMLPVAGTELARSWDQLFWFLFVVNLILFFVVIGPVVYFAIKYRAQNGRKASKVSHNTPLEIVWTAIPTVIVMVIFAWGFILYKDMYHNPPSNAQEVRVVARSWGWTFQYPHLDNRTTDDLLVVQVNRPVRLVMTAATGDVIHSFFVPNFRLKKDLVPGLFTETWFESNMVGRHIYFCTEYCGVGHSRMWGAVAVLSEEDYRDWQWGKEIELPPWVGVGALRDELLARGIEDVGSAGPQLASFQAGEDLVAKGKNLSRQKGCAACHSSDGSDSIGPSYLGLYGTKAKLVDGTKVLRDENYIRESIVNPQAKIVAGYENVFMPPYPGMIVSDREMDALISYIRSLSE